MKKREFLMRSATWNNFNGNILNCDMNIQIRKIQEKSLYYVKIQQNIALATINEIKIFNIQK